MSDVSLFMLIGLIAIISAIMMLLSRNAVHSALFLIVNFACVAFLYLMLDAPFLAMIQIAVYAGAIMVLFLFVIMLLGAEKTNDASQYRWLTPAALFLSVFFLLTVGSAVVNGKIDLVGGAGAPPLLRVVHVATDSDRFDVFVDGQPFAAAMRFSDASPFSEIAPGEHTLVFAPAGLGPNAALAAQTMTFEPGTTYTAVVYGESLLPSLQVVVDDISSVNQRRSGRVLVFNAQSTPVSLVDLGPNRRFSGGEDDDRVLLTAVSPGTLAQPLIRQEGSAALAVVSPANQVIVQLRDFRVSRDTSQLLILANERLFDETLRPLALPLVTDALASFGGPQSVGQLLFTRYLLPFEMVAVLLLAAMIGVIVLARQEDVPGKRRLGVRRKVSRPLTSVIAAQTGHDVGADALLSAEGAPEKNEPAGD